ncbi:MAG: putative flavin-nucleotide-binding protein [Sporomusa sp.]|nr:putative flavin-nucleotide-binding protein [Sporomusa sp.]
MFKQMRRCDRQAGVEDTVAILEKCEYGVLSTVNPDSVPYGVPLSYIYKDGSIYFHSAGEGHKLDNITANSKVSFCVVGDKKSLPEKFTTNYESVIVFGQASPVQGAEKEAVLLALISKYAPDHMVAGAEYARKAGDKTTVIKVIIEHITGKVRA